MAKARMIYVCRDCGYETGQWLGRCPLCGSFSTLEQTEAAPAAVAKKTPVNVKSAMTLADVPPMTESRTPTGLSELDNVLSGGIVEGSLILLGGDPGIGKSTLLLQICQHLGDCGKRVLYVSGEESARQIKLRADRLEVSTKNLYIAAETDMPEIESVIDGLKPDLVIIDSIQTITSEDTQSVPGSVSQVRSCTSALMRIAKGSGTAIFIVGHVTKEGAIAGPRVLEHMVDTVLYFEGERREAYRIIRAVKNRFGSTNEIGVFEMRAKGLVPISNPSEYMLAGRPLNVPGSVVTCSMEGSRPILTEVQALVCATSFNMPRRTATGLDFNRSVMLLAVLEKRGGLKLSAYDCYLNIAGGVRIAEPSLDAAVIAAAASGFTNKACDPYTMVFGEVGLTGEMRAVNMTDKRIAEARKLGFKQCVIPTANLKGLNKPENCRVLGAANINELLLSIHVHV
ncbi:MAG: DNA repair protein RadA [Clostridiales bacterium]|nr:DNA repair protein RadA [Clostridiales bacterium]